MVSIKKRKSKDDDYIKDSIKNFSRKTRSLRGQTKNSVIIS